VTLRMSSPARLAGSSLVNLELAWQIEASDWPIHIPAAKPTSPAAP
jgi:hypothetical protein